MMRYGDTKIKMLRDAAKGRSCVRCGRNDGTVVGAHYTGVRRLSYGGGFGRKVHDLVMAHLCAECHQWMDQALRATMVDEDEKWHHSEEFLHLCMLTLLRLYEEEPRLLYVAEAHEL